MKAKVIGNVLLILGLLGVLSVLWAGERAVWLFYTEWGIFLGVFIPLSILVDFTVSIYLIHFANDSK